MGVKSNMIPPGSFAVFSGLTLVVAQVARMTVDDQSINGGSQSINAGPQSIIDGPQSFNDEPQSISRGTQRTNDEAQDINHGAQSINDGPQNINGRDLSLNGEPQRSNDQGRNSTVGASGMPAGLDFIVQAFGSTALRPRLLKVAPAALFRTRPGHPQSRPGVRAV